MPRCRTHGSWTPLRGPAPPKDPGGTAQESVSAQGGTHSTPPCTQDPTRHPGPGKQARRHLLTLSRRWQLPQEVHHATLDPVRNHGTLIESRAAFRIPRTSRTLRGIAWLPQRIPHVHPYPEGLPRNKPHLVHHVQVPTMFPTRDSGSQMAWTSWIRFYPVRPRASRSGGI